MASIERKINGTFAPVPGGYARQIDPHFYMAKAHLFHALQVEKSKR